MQPGAIIALNEQSLGTEQFYSWNFYPNFLCPEVWWTVRREGTGRPGRTGSWTRWRQDKTAAWRTRWSNSPEEKKHFLKANFCVAEQKSAKLSRLKTWLGIHGQRSNHVNDSFKANPLQKFKKILTHYAHRLVSIIWSWFDPADVCAYQTQTLDLDKIDVTMIFGSIKEHLPC